MFIKENCYTSQLKYIFQLEENMSQFVIFELGGITKHLMTGPEGNSEFCFPLTLHVPLHFTSKNIEGPSETNLTVSLWVSH